MVDSIDSINTLIEVVLEIRFKPIVNEDELYHRLLKQLDDEFSRREELPLKSAPQEIKNSPEVRFAPYRRWLESKTDSCYTLLQGPCMIAISSSPYKGWLHFSKFAMNIINKTCDTNIFYKIDRVGFKLVNFVPRDLFKGELDFNISLNGKEIPYEETTIRTVLKDTENAGVATVLQISNGVSLNSKNESVPGTVVDIDTIHNSIAGFESIEIETLEHVHQIGKNIYRSIVNQRMLDNCK